MQTATRQVTNSSPTHPTCQPTSRLQVFFKIKRTTKLNKLKNAYADRVGKQMNAIRCVSPSSLAQERFVADQRRGVDSSTRAERFWTMIRPSRLNLRMVRKDMRRSKWLWLMGDRVNVVQVMLSRFSLNVRIFPPPSLPQNLTFLVQ
jgi:hypothetical protein